LFGSLPLRPGEPTQDFGQTVDFSSERMTPARTISIDSQGLARLT
jgi:hypothetical protein